MKNRSFLPGRAGRHQIADLHLCFGDNDSINEKLHQLLLLFETGLRQALLHAFAEALHIELTATLFTAEAKLPFQDIELFLFVS